MMWLVKRMAAGLVLGALAQLAGAADAPLNTAGTIQPSGPGILLPSDTRTRAKAHTELGAEYFRLGDIATAISELQTAIELDSGYFEAFSVRGLVYTQIKEYAKAEEDFRRAMDLAPKDSQVKNNYGWFLCQSGKERKAISYFLDAIKDPLYATPDLAYLNAGRCAVKAGDQDGALGYLLQALRVARDGGVDARLQLADLLYRKGNYEEARYHLNEALKLIGEPPAEAVWLGLRLERKLGNRAAEGSYAAQLRSRYGTTNEYQEFLKGNFE